MYTYMYMYMYLHINSTVLFIALWQGLKRKKSLLLNQPQVKKRKWSQDCQYQMLKGSSSEDSSSFIAAADSDSSSDTDLEVCVVVMQESVCWLLINVNYNSHTQNWWGR